MNDFATEEFLTKNIRVRPISGITGKDFDERQSERVSRNNLIGGVVGEQTDEEEKFNNAVNSDMDQQRKEFKERRRDFEKAKIQEADKQARAQAKKK